MAQAQERGRWRSLRVPSAVLAVAALAAACSSTDTASPTSTSTSAPGRSADGTLTQVRLGPPDDPGPPKDGGSIVMGLEAEPTVLDPSRGTFDQSAFFIASAVYDPLVSLDENGRWEPYLAESITPNDDFTEWTITLRDGVTFHDGSPLDADALALNFDYWTESFITAPSLSSVESYAVTGPLELTVTMRQPWATFPYALAIQTGFVAAPAALTNADPQSVAMAPIGTGPFRATSHTPGESFEVVRNDDYWQEGLPHLDSMTFRFIPDPQGRLDAMESGDIDMMHGYRPIELTEMRRLAEAGEVKAQEIAELEEDVVSINTEVAPFNDPEARRALALATDAETWRAENEAGTSHDVHGPFAPGQVGHSTDDAFPAYDLEEAKRLAASYEARTGAPIRATYLTTGNVFDQQIAQQLTEQWAAAGIEVTTESSDLASLIFSTVSGDYQLVSWRNFGAPDPDGEYLWWHSSGILAAPKISTNVARFADPEVDAALDRARGTDDDAVRQEAYASVVRELNDNVAYVWLGRPTWVIAAKPEVQGIGAAANGSGANLANKTWVADLWVDR